MSPTWMVIGNVPCAKSNVYLLSLTEDSCAGAKTHTSCADPDGAGGSGPPTSEKSQNIGFLSNIGPDASYQASIQCWAIIDTPAKRYLNGVSLVG